MPETKRPRFSIVSAVYDVAPYLDDFFRSLDAQTLGLDDTEIILVDDGSTDGQTPALVDAWAEGRANVTVVHQENAGQGAARNAGMALARGEWVTFPDPDDVLEPEYLAVVEEFLTAHPEADMVATHRIMWEEAKGTIRNTHPLRSMFTGSPYVNLAQTPERFHGSSPATFFRLDRIRELDLAFDHRVRPNFEDGHFNCRYLLSLPEPKVGFLEKARYRYRKRSAGGSTLQTSRQHPGRYTDVPEHGYLDVLRRAQDAYGEIPGWLASFVLYELHWYFKFPDASNPAAIPTEGPVAERFHELAAEILALLPERSTRYIPPSVPYQARLVMAHGYGPAWHDETVLLENLDLEQRLVRASYHFTGDEPEAVWTLNGEQVTPAHTKVRTMEFYGRPLLHERIAWLPVNGTLRVELAGTDATVSYERPIPLTTVAPVGQVLWWLDPNSSKNTEAVPPHARPAGKKVRLARRLLEMGRRQRFNDAWVFIDRVHDANDSAEILFRHVREKHPEINAWFVLEKGTPEWDRFRREGHGDRLVAYGSTEWLLLMVRASHLLSSHADGAIVRPPRVAEVAQPRWRFHFLQHGVIKDDLSSWLNPKRIDTFVTSTREETASIAGDGTSYVFTTREVAETGLPRFDRLREIGLRFPAEKRDLLLVAPTWRNGLMPPIVPGTQRREVDPAILESEFIRSWLAVVRDEKVAQACKAAGVRLGFLPHPNLQPLMPLIELPGHVLPLTYEGQDVQELFARARALVTDFSSVAFNAAYLERPVVYYQFDEDVVLGGGHVGRKGYFEYRRDGFGPVTVDHASAVDAIVEALASPQPAAAYQARIDHSFPQRDGLCSERVVQRVLAMSRNQTAVEPVAAPTSTPS